MSPLQAQSESDVNKSQLSEVDTKKLAQQKKENILKAISKMKLHSEADLLLIFK